MLYVPVGAAFRGVGESGGRRLCLVRGVFGGGWGSYTVEKRTFLLEEGGIPKRLLLLLKDFRSGDWGASSVWGIPGFSGNFLNVCFSKIFFCEWMTRGGEEKLCFSVAGLFHS